MSFAERKAREARQAPRLDVAHPRPGAKLVLGVVAARLGVTVSQMAEATGQSRTTVARILSNEWPVRADCDAIKHALRELLEQRGCTDDELLTLFHGYGPAAPASYAHIERTKRSDAAPAAQPEDTDMLLAKQSLTLQARKHFKLGFINPFDGEVQSDEGMFMGEDIRYAREAMWHCVQNAGFMALVGESGAGKTTLWQDLENRLASDSRSVIVIRPSVLGMEGNDTKGKALKSADILHAIISELDANAVVPQTLQARTEKVKRLMTASAQAGNQHLVVIEEGHSMPDAALKHLKRLHEMRLGRKPLLGILLLAQPELKQRLADGLRNGTLREVAQRCEIVDLLPLDGALKGYLERRMAAVKRPLSELMDDQAVEQLRERLTFKRGNGYVSMTYPLAVNNMVTRALNTAAELGVPVVTRDVVKGC